MSETVTLVNQNIKIENEVMVEIYSKSPARAIGKVLHMKSSYNII